MFTDLRRLSSDIFYYRTRSGKEVDFIVQMPDRSYLLVQVCESLSDPATRKRELAALHEAMTEMPSSLATIVTRNDEEIIESDTGKITVVPVWKWLLR